MVQKQQITTQSKEITCNVNRHPTTHSGEVAAYNCDPKDHVKLLGIHINKNLTWSAHTEKLAHDLSRRLPLLNRLAHIISKKIF